MISTIHTYGRARATTLVGLICLASLAMPFGDGSVAARGDQRVTSPAAGDGLAAVAELGLRQLTSYVNSGSRVDLVGYQLTRASIAAEVGRRLLLDVGRLEAAWAEADYVHQTALMAAFSQLGTPYRRNTSKPGVGFDCSGLTTYAWGVAGVALTRQSGSQIDAASPRTIETAMAGDLVQYPGHVMMYLGVDTAIVHAIQPGRPVEVDFAAKRRVLRFGEPT